MDYQCGNLTLAQRTCMLRVVLLLLCSAALVAWLSFSATRSDPAQAQQDKTASSLPASSPKREFSLPDPQKQWALVIGISNYTKLEPLKYAAADARSIRDFLASPRGGGIPSDHITSLAEENASRARIILALDELIEKVKPDDRIFIYLAGYSVFKNGSAFLMPIDGDKRAVVSTCVSLIQFQEIIEAGLAHAGQRIIISDLCNADLLVSRRTGAKVDTPPGTVLSSISQSVTKLLSKYPGAYLSFAACQPTEVAYETDDLGGGVFTRILLEGLNGKAVKEGEKVVIARHLVAYVSSEVAKFTAGAQHPMVNADFDPDLQISFLTERGPVTSR